MQLPEGKPTKPYFNINEKSPSVCLKRTGILFFIIINQENSTFSLPNNHNQMLFFH